MFSVTGNLNLLSQFQELSASTLRYHTVKEPMDATRFKRNQLIFSPIGMQNVNRRI